jgi:hypothetical protein
MKKLLIALFLWNYLYAGEFALSFGMQDMIIPDARPLSRSIYENRASGSDSHTIGFNIGLHAKSDTTAFVQQEGYFRILRDFDKDHLDPDHIPLWFIGEYEAKVVLGDLQSYGKIFADIDLSGKANSVSCVERLLRFFGGVQYEYKNNKLSITSALLAGRYSLEIDDDTPAQRGYLREDLKNIYAATSLKLYIDYQIQREFLLYSKFQIWQKNANELVEKYAQIGLSYDSNSLISKSKLYMEMSYDWYDISQYQKPGLMPILPWDKDILFNIYLKIPVDFQELFTKR